MDILKKSLIRVKKIFTPSQVSEGAGAKVTRVIGNRAITGDMDPFLMLDYFNTRLPAGFPDHPHRGFETVTYLQHGKIFHEDFKGNKGVLEPGDIQWMTAGKGIVHAEMPGSFDEDTIGFQLWINLRSKDKMIDPVYQEIKKDKLPIIEKDGARVVIIAGEALGEKGPIQTRTPTFYLDIQLQKNTEYHQYIPKGFNSLAFVYAGQGYFGEKQELATTKQGVRFETDQEADELIVKTKDQPCSFIIFAGEPLKEPIAQHGPFVMNNQNELRQTFEDFYSGQNGFENARNWESEIQHMPEKRKN